MAEDELVRRIDEAVAERGTSDRKASLAATDGSNPDFLRDLKRRGKRGPIAGILTRLETVLDVPSGYFVSVAGGDIPQPRPVLEGVNGSGQSIEDQLLAIRAAWHLMEPGEREVIATAIEALVSKRLKAN